MATREGEGQLVEVSTRVSVSTQAPSTKKGPGSYPEKQQAPSLTWKESWNVLLRKVGAFCESQTGPLWESTEGSRALLSNRNIM